MYIDAWDIPNAYSHQSQKSAVSVVKEEYQNR
jgi:hypothetical protein